MPDQTTRVEAAIEQAMHKIAGVIGMYAGQVISHNTALHEIQQEIVKILRESGIDQTAESAPSAESVGRAMLALPHLAAADVLAVAKLIDAGREAEQAIWAERLDNADRVYQAQVTEAEAKIDLWQVENEVIKKQLGHARDQLDEAMRHGEHGEAARWKALFDDRGETIAAWQRHADHLRAELLKAQGEAADQIGFSEAQRSMVLNAALESGQAAERVASAAGKLDLLYSTCMKLAEDMAPSVMPVVEAVQMVIDRDTAHEQRRRQLQALGASLAEIDDYESRAFDVAAQVKRRGWPLDYITIAAFDEPEPQEGQRPEARPGSLESRRVQLIELGQKGPDIDRFVADVLDSAIDQVRAGSTIPYIRIEPMPTTKPEAAIFTADDVRATLAKAMKYQRMGTLAGLEDYSRAELILIRDGMRVLPDLVADNFGYTRIPGTDTYTRDSD